jgi:sugar O-acyltransferase (sialic acid O-acetyltransferase NeuD family)
VSADAAALELVVYGAGGHGKVVAMVARAAGFRVVAFVDDAAVAAPARAVPVVRWGAVRARGGPPPAVALAVGDNARREALFRTVRDEGFRTPALVHPASAVAEDARVGEGSVLMPGAIVNPDATLGPGVIVNSAAVIEHDCVVGAFVHLSPNSTLGGGVRVGDRTHVGIGASVLPGVTIGADVRVGAGAVVNRDVPDGTTVVGVPARPIVRTRGEETP